ncbi:MAG: DUF1273 family protein [Firmicutes bacterium]|nr:DUF1273 family protein [Bacillota bacterium]
MIAGGDDEKEINVMLLQRVFSLLYSDYGVRKIISGIHKGKELFALDHLLCKKEEFPFLKIHGVFTHEEEANLWDEKDREKLYHVIRNCDEEWILKPIYGKEMRFQRNIVMMNASDLVFLLGKDKEIVFWASKLKKPLLFMDESSGRVLPDLHLWRDNSGEIR